MRFSVRFSPLVAGVLLASLCSLSAFTQVASSPTLAQLSASFEQAFARKDFAAAEASMRSIVQLQPANVGARYNLALAIAASDDAQRVPEAASLIASAIEDGFSDARRILRDSTLASVREHPDVAALLSDWASVHERQRTTLVRRAQEDFASATHRLTLSELRIELLTNLPEDEAGLIASELAKVHAFVTAHALPSDAELGIDAILAAAREANPQQATNNDALWAPPWSVVIIPAKPDFDRWLQALLSPASQPAPTAPRSLSSSAVGGLYDHASKRLVAIDAGPTLRHEFAHVLHQRLCERIGQVHPVWMLEGLATLVEDMDPLAGNPEDPASWMPTTSWRTNAARRMAIAGVLPPLGSLARMPPEQFSGSRALAHYAGIRSAFVWLHEQGLLRALLREFITSKQHGIGIESTGWKAMQHVATLAQPALASDDALERALRDAARARRTVPEETRPGSPTLGVVVEMRQGVGLVVVQVPAPTLRGPPPTTLREGDVIVRVKHFTTRDISELLRVLPLATEGLLDRETSAEVSVIVRRDEALKVLSVPVSRAK
jgi:hypothetical protein